MATFELAQLNIAQMREALDSPLLADFVANLDRINALAESMPGFIWRLQTEDGDATALRPFGDDTLVNVSTWADLDSLKAFVYGPAHVEIMRRRREWFHAMAQSHLVLWWVPAGHRPDEQEAKSRLQHLQRAGASAHAFTFREFFAAPIE